jgi:hypothetical protein
MQAASARHKIGNIIIQSAAQPERNVQIPEAEVRIDQTDLLSQARDVPKLAVTVVLPTPPLPEVIQMTLAIEATHPSDQNTCCNIYNHRTRTAITYLLYHREIYKNSTKRCCFFTFLSVSIALQQRTGRKQRKNPPFPDRPFEKSYPPNRQILKANCNSETFYFLDHKKTAEPEPAGSAAYDACHYGLACVNLLMKL